MGRVVAAVPAGWSVCPGARGEVSLRALAHGTVLRARAFSSVAASGHCFGEDARVQYEVTLLSAGLLQIGWCATPTRLPFSGADEGVGDFPLTVGLDGCRGVLWSVSGTPLKGVAWLPGDVVSCYADFASGLFEFAINGVLCAAARLPTAGSLAASAAPWLGEAGAPRDELLCYFPALSLEAGQACVVNIGEHPMAHPRPGFVTVAAATQELLAVAAGDEVGEAEHGGAALLGGSDVTGLLLPMVPPGGASECFRACRDGTAPALALLRAAVGARGGDAAGVAAAAALWSMEDSAQRRPALSVLLSLLLLDALSTDAGDGGDAMTEERRRLSCTARPRQSSQSRARRRAGGVLLAALTFLPDDVFPTVLCDLLLLVQHHWLAASAPRRRAGFALLRLLAATPALAASWPTRPDILGSLVLNLFMVFAPSQPECAAVADAVSRRGPQAPLLADDDDGAVDVCEVDEEQRHLWSEARECLRSLQGRLDVTDTVIAALRDFAAADGLAVPEDLCDAQDGSARDAGATFERYPFAYHFNTSSATLAALCLAATAAVTDGCGDAAAETITTTTTTTTTAPAATAAAAALALAPPESVLRPHRQEELLHHSGVANFDVRIGGSYAEVQRVFQHRNDSSQLPNTDAAAHHAGSTAKAPTSNAQRLFFLAAAMDHFLLDAHEALREPFERARCSLPERMSATAAATATRVDPSLLAGSSFSALSPPSPTSLKDAPCRRHQCPELVRFTHALKSLRQIRIWLREQRGEVEQFAVLLHVILDYYWQLWVAHRTGVCSPAVHTGGASPSCVACAETTATAAVPPYVYYYLPFPLVTTATKLWLLLSSSFYGPHPPPMPAAVLARFLDPFVRRSISHPTVRAHAYRCVAVILRHARADTALAHSLREALPLLQSVIVDCLDVFAREQPDCGDGDDDDDGSGAGGGGAGSVALEVLFEAAQGCSCALPPVEATNEVFWWLQGSRLRHSPPPECPRVGDRDSQSGEDEDEALLAAADTALVAFRAVAAAAAPASSYLALLLRSCNAALSRLSALCPVPAPGSSAAAPTPYDAARLTSRYWDLRRHLYVLEFACRGGCGAAILDAELRLALGSLLLQALLRLSFTALIDQAPLTSADGATSPAAAHSAAVLLLPSSGGGGGDCRECSGALTATGLLAPVLSMVLVLLESDDINDGSLARWGEGPAALASHALRLAEHPCWWRDPCERLAPGEERVGPRLQARLQRLQTLLRQRLEQQQRGAEVASTAAADTQQEGAPAECLLCRARAADVQVLPCRHRCCSLCLLHYRASQRRPEEIAFRPPPEWAAHAALLSMPKESLQDNDEEAAAAATQACASSNAPALPCFICKQPISNVAQIA